MSQKFPFDDVEEEYLTDAQARVILGDLVLRAGIVSEGKATIEDLVEVKLKTVEPDLVLRLRALMQDEG